MKTKYILLAVLFSTLVSQAQVGIGTNTPSPSSILEIASDDKGILIPRVELRNTTSSFPLSSHITSMMVFNTATTSDVIPGFYYSLGSKWVRLNNFDDVDIRFVGNNNHVSKDAGIGSNGTSVGSSAFNVAIGQNSMSSNVSGNSNVALGLNALTNNTTGHSNMALGENAMFSNINGVNNVSLGPNSLYGNISGGGNVALGVNSMLSNVDGSQNVALGPNALQSNTAGNSNIAIGDSALNSNDNGSSNVAIGEKSLFSNQNGSNNM